MKTLKLVTAILARTSGVALAGNPMIRGASMFEDKTIVDTTVNLADHTTHGAALEAAGLVETLQGAGPFTFFAPTNDASAKLPAGTVETPLKPENRERLTTILTCHVVAANAMSPMSPVPMSSSRTGRSM